MTGVLLTSSLPCMPWQCATQKGWGGAAQIAAQCNDKNRVKMTRMMQNPQAIPKAGQERNFRSFCGLKAVLAAYSSTFDFCVFFVEIGDSVQEKVPMRPENKNGCPSLAPKNLQQQFFFTDNN